MITYRIEVNEEMNEIIKKNAEKLGLSPEKVIEQIVNRFLVPLHNINRDEMAQGYELMGEINLELANL